MVAENEDIGETLDCTLLVVTPENVRFDYRLAGPFPRMVAYAVDVMVITIIIMVCAFAFFATLGFASTGFILAGMFALLWGYAAVLETFWNGQTVGKKILDLRVVSENGLPINGQQAALRGFLRTADLVPYALMGALSMLFSSRFQRLGDRAAGTIVIVEGKHGRIAPAIPVDTKKLSTDIIPPKFRPDAATIKAITLFVSRREKLSPARRREIAWYLARHFIRMWSLPERTDPDELLCLLYSKFMSNTAKSRQQAFSFDADVQSDFSSMETATGRLR